MAIKEFFANPFRVFYALIWAVIIGAFCVGIFYSITTHPIFLVVNFYSVMFAIMFALPFLSRKARVTHSWKAMFFGIINAHRRLWRYAVDRDDKAFIDDMINGD